MEAEAHWIYPIRGRPRGLIWLFAVGIQVNSSPKLPNVAGEYSTLNVEVRIVALPIMRSLRNGSASGYHPGLSYGGMFTTGPETVYIPVVR